MRWHLSDDESIKWEVQQDDSHVDNVEMSGFQISSIVYYGVEKGALQLTVKLVFPGLRTIPNDTHASLIHSFDLNSLQTISQRGNILTEYPDFIEFDGILKIFSKTKGGLSIEHQLFPSTDEPAFFDKIRIKNNSENPFVFELAELDYSTITESSEGVRGAYLISAHSDTSGSFTLAPNESLYFSKLLTARELLAKETALSVNYEIEKRKNFIHLTRSNLVLETPEESINQAFSFAKLRAVESIFETKGGLMHGPGGGRYYAAIWANDQAEYANPFFPFLGNIAGDESAINSFRHFARYMNSEFKAIPSSIIAEGESYWNGAGDRGDMAMIAYGAGRFALAYGRHETARELWPLIAWCLEYCKRNLNKDGVVASDSDELEGRFPAGKANLNTSCLYYDALLSAVYVAEELDLDPIMIEDYWMTAKTLKSSIDKYFSSYVEGFDTYRYYAGNDKLRAWICTPLTVGIYDKKEGTQAALFSDKLWTEDGLASESGSTTFWDRATLYALRGVFASGETAKAYPFFLNYSNRRLLGEHVPYPVEAYPEGNQRHLSAESALYCRIITEGMLNIRPIGFSSFFLQPVLPEAWNFIRLKKIKAFNHTFDIDVQRQLGGYSIRVSKDNGASISKEIMFNETLRIDLDDF
jgi:hypothetical protein